MRYFLSLLLAINLYALTTEADLLYKKTLRSLSQLLRELDMALGESNDTAIKQRFSIRTSIGAISESRKGTKFRFNIRANLTLPRAQKRLYLFLSDYKRSEDIDENTQKTISDSIKNSSFLLGIQYLTKHNLRYRAGIKLKNSSLDPFVAAIWEDTAYIGDNSWIYFGDRLFYYAVNKTDNTLFASLQRRIGKKSVLSFENSYRFEQKPLKEHQFTHTLASYVSLGKYKTLVPKLQFFFNQNSRQGYRLNYILSGAQYESRFWRRWLFYQLSLYAVFRNEYDFRPGIRTAVSIGITFEQN